MTPLAMALLVLSAQADCEEQTRVVERERILVLDLQTDARTAAAAPALQTVIAEELGRARGLEVLSTAELRAVLEQEAGKQLMGCDESSCLAEVAEAMNAGLLVSGSFIEVDGVPQVSLSLMNTRAILTIGRVSFPWPGATKELPEVARAAAQLLVFEPEMRPPGGLALVGVPADATLLIDDEDTAAKASGDGLIINDLPIGPHTLRVLKDGFVEVKLPFLVRSGQTQKLSVNLESADDSSVWLTPTLIVGGALVAAGALGGYLYAVPPKVTVRAPIRAPSLGAAR